MKKTMTFEEFLELYVNGDIEITSCETVYSDECKTCIEVEAIVIQPVNHVMIDVNLKL